MVVPGYTTQAGKEENDFQPYNVLQRFQPWKQSLLTRDELTKPRKQHREQLRTILFNRHLQLVWPCAWQCVFLFL
jgi:hypothetical protein